MRKKLDLREKLKMLSPEAAGTTPLLKAVNAAEIELGEPRTKPTLGDFELELDEITSKASFLDKTKGDRLEQILSLQGGNDIKWTALVDPFAEKFASMVSDGLTEIKTLPPIFGSRFTESSILASHIKGYTFTLASYEVDFDKLVEIFTAALKYAKEKLHLE
ncbi:MAG: hypothetical protein V3T58_00130 [Candidatus Hydrothermarchaeales archaeon]